MITKLICSFWLLAMIIPAGASGDLEAESLFSRASCDFAISLLQTQSKQKDDNIILSPSSIGTLLAILQQGARENTLKQLEAVLSMTADQSRNGHSLVIKSLQRDKKNVTFDWGSRGYIRPGIHIADAFNASIRDNFGAAIEELDFFEPSTTEAANVINSWVAEITRDNIKNLISPSVLTPDTVFILLNAVYFKGLWDVPFKKALTKEKTFEPSSNNSVQAFFMSQEERFVAGVDPDSGIQWVDLPFKDEQFSMLFLLPTEKHGLNRVMEKMSGSLLKKIIDHWETKQVTLSIPKFKLDIKVLLSKALTELGLTDIFTEAANLHGIAPNYTSLSVSRIIHQATVEVDESGSTASAATGFASELLSFPKSDDHLDFIADHPFLFFILDKTNRIPLFAGKVVHPS